MSEQTPEQPVPDDTSEETGQEQQPAAAPEKPDPDWKAESRKWEQRAKENKAAAAELEKQRKASMTEADRNIAEAETRGRTAAATDFGKRLARTEFDAAAARRNSTVDTAAVLEYVDLGRFVGEDGEPDSAAIAAAVERLVPEPQGTTTPAFDGGVRQTAPSGVDMNGLIRKAAGRA